MKINVTKTFLPPIEEYQSQLQRAWKNEWLTNRGELVLELEANLKNHLKVSNIILMNNGTIPLQIALKLLGKNGEIITTPFSYVATTSAIVWENCTPVFVDIHPEYLTIDENKIKDAITDKTTAILATHVFGNPCHLEAIEAIAREHHLAVIYDAAHCFGVTYKGKSVFDYGTASSCSFHATKLFHTGEGGAVFCNDEQLFDKFYQSHNFGHKTALDFHGLGINGKMSELQAALGLAVLPYMTHITEGRKKAVTFYNEHLDFTLLQRMKIREFTEWNYSYYPVIFQDEAQLLKIESALVKEDVIPRRYFYPSLNNLPYCKNSPMPNSESVSSSILCLPLYADMPLTDLERIAHIVNTNLSV
ncbi:DegT/DnrJ/EryC1/StrS family aminotransferase [Flavobacterium pallidum]|nr:DegT/DnrJ/EryC1/StrS family aminotransferase [Flavobacterium pallidum]